MKKILLLTVLLSSDLILAKINKAAFGTDDRRDIFQTTKSIKRFSTGVGLWQSPFLFNKTAEGYQLDFPTLGEEWNLCQGEKFREQPTNVISCTGFLIGPDLMLTAGHCMLNVGEAIDEVTPQCSDFNWMFDFKYDRNLKQNILVNKSLDSVVGCKKVIYAIHEEGGDRRDFALIRLNRKLPNRYHFPINTKKVKVGDTVALLGHPSGLPMKFSGAARVLRTRKDAQFYESNLDSFGGNSGSPVFNKKGEVRGILVRGPRDFVEDKKRGCDRWNRCSFSGKNCKADDPTDNSYDWNSGMHVQRITPEIVKLIDANR